MTDDADRRAAAFASQYDPPNPPLALSSAQAEALRAWQAMSADDQGRAIGRLQQEAAYQREAGYPRRADACAALVALAEALGGD